MATFIVPFPPPATLETAPDTIALFVCRGLGAGIRLSVLGLSDCEDAAVAPPDEEDPSSVLSELEQATSAISISSEPSIDK